MPTPPERAALIAVLVLDALHLWRVSLLAVTLAHERTHPALALILLAPINHALFALMTGLHPEAPTHTRKRNWRQLTGIAPLEPLSKPWALRLALVTMVCALASYALVLWYGSYDRLVEDLEGLAKTPQWWALIAALVALMFLLYGPMWAAFRRFAQHTGLSDARPWKALAVGMGVWIWVDAMFAALLQQVALIPGQSSFTQDLTSFFDAFYFSTITLATVGFGDITPVSSLARALVLVEVMVGLGLLGFVLGRAVGYASSPVDTDTERR